MAEFCRRFGGTCLHLTLAKWRSLRGVMLEAIVDPEDVRRSHCETWDHFQQLHDVSSEKTECIAGIAVIALAVIVSCVEGYRMTEKRVHEECRLLGCYAVWLL
jgi:hypothetical protein